MKKFCKQCGGENSKPRSEYCSAECSHLYRKAHNKKKCEACKKEHTRRGRSCSNECAKELRKIANLKKYGTEWAIQSEEAKIKRVDTNLEKYGAEHHLQTKESLEKLRETNREKYGTDYVGQNEEIKSRIAQTNLEKYGSTNVLNSKEIREKIERESMEKNGTPFPQSTENARRKIKETNLERYGVENVFSNEEVKEKIKKTMNEKYGVDHPSHSEVLIGKIKATNLLKFGVPVSFQSEIVKEKSKLTNLEKLGVEYPTQSEEVREKVARTLEENLKNGLTISRGRISNVNREFAERAKSSFDVDVSFEKSFGKGYSSDLYVEKYGVMIDINPTVTHNSDVSFQCLIGRCGTDCNEHKGVSNTYHQSRSRTAAKSGLSLIQVYQWDFSRFEDLIKGKIGLRSRKLSAKKLELKKISQREANAFLKSSHYQGAAKTQTYCYGLFDGSDLVAVGTFGKSRFGSKYEYEFIRYAVEDGATVYGGASRIFRKFINDANPETVISYVNFDHSTGPSFLKGLGFEELSPTNPALFWSKGDRGVNSNSVMMQGADRILGTQYGSMKESGLTNQEIMQNEGFVRIFTSGNRVFVWRNPEI